MRYETPERLERLQTGMQILKEELAPASNRIHADDLAKVCVTAMFHSPANEIFNVADGNPSSMSDYFKKVAIAFNLPEPEEVSWEYAEKYFSAGMLSYLRESKKISIKKLTSILPVDFDYPTLNLGLQQCLEQQNKQLI